MIVILNATLTEVQVGDPLPGDTTYTADEFRHRWQKGRLTFHAGLPPPAAN